MQICLLSDLCCNSAYRYRFLVRFQLLCEFFECVLRIIRLPTPQIFTPS